ncbi:hypothetical protein CDL15_Pgr011477 [Punica granatum]|nr:hypothetical protein CDL15_Pgr011477 [Punica granatum]
MAEGGGGGRRPRNCWRRTELKKIENKFAREVTFTKRRGGLFKKASELAVLCGADVAIIAYSPHGNPFVFSSSSSTDGVLRRFIGSPTSAAGEDSGVMPLSMSCEDRLSEYRRQEKEALSRLNEAKKKQQEASGKGKPGWWWDNPIEDLEAEELECYIECVERLMEKASQKAEEMRTNPVHTSATTSPASASMASAGRNMVDTLDTGLFETSNGAEAAVKEEFGMGDEELESLSSLLKEFEHDDVGCMPLWS